MDYLKDYSKLSHPEWTFELFEAELKGDKIVKYCVPELVQKIYSTITEIHKVKIIYASYCLHQEYHAPKYQFTLFDDSLYKWEYHCDLQYPLERINSIKLLSYTPNKLEPITIKLFIDLVKLVAHDSNQYYATYLRENNSNCQNGVPKSRFLEQVDQFIKLLTEVYNPLFKLVGSTYVAIPLEFSAMAELNNSLKKIVDQERSDYKDLQQRMQELVSRLQIRDNFIEKLTNECNNLREDLNRTRGLMKELEASYLHEQKAFRDQTFALESLQLNYTTLLEKHNHTEKNYEQQTELLQNDLYELLEVKKNLEINQKLLKQKTKQLEAEKTLHLQQIKDANDRLSVLATEVQTLQNKLSQQEKNKRAQVLEHYFKEKQSHSAS
jgi:hypothetical protein